MRILVVGGAGYIGSIVTEHLLARGFEVLVFDNLLRGHREAVPENAEFMLGDLANRNDLERAFEKNPDAVMHFAALSLVGESMQQPGSYFDSIVVNGLRLLDAALRAGVTKLVFSSTAAVYGNPAVTPISEDQPLLPTNPYGDAKLAYEKLLKWYANAYGLKYASLRYFNAAGATAERGEDHTPETHLIPVILDVARGNRSYATVFGDDYPTHDGTCIRDYIHVSDLAEAHILALSALDDHPVQIYNLGSERGFSVKEVIEAARRVTGHPVPVEIGPRREGDPAVLVASSARIKSVLGWQPVRTDLDIIIRDAWLWHSRHPSGYTREQSCV